MKAQFFLIGYFTFLDQLSRDAPRSSHLRHSGA